MTRIPMFARKAIVDFVETALALMFALTLTIPGSLDEAKAVGIVVASAVLSALISAARRAIPGFLAWFRRAMATDDPAS